MYRNFRWFRLKGETVTMEEIGVRGTEEEEELKIDASTTKALLLLKTYLIAHAL